MKWEDLLLVVYRKKMGTKEEDYREMFIAEALGNYEELNKLFTSLEKEIKYILTTEEVKLYMPEALIPEVELSLYSETKTLDVFFIKIKDSYYKLFKTDTITTAKISTFKAD